MSFSNVIEMIEKLPHERQVLCRKCGAKSEVSSLAINQNCPHCSNPMKLRGYASIGSEVEDVIDAVLKWMGSGKRLEAVLKRKEELDSR